MNDQELNARVARHVGEWILCDNKPGYGIAPTGGFLRQLPDYLNDANALLPLLLKLHYWRAEIFDWKEGGMGRGVEIIVINEDGRQSSARGTTLLRAACRALLLLNGGLD